MGGCCVKLKLNGDCSVSGDECKKEGGRRSLLNIYKDPRLVFDLRELRAERSWERAMTDPLLFGEFGDMG